MCIGSTSLKGGGEEQQFIGLFVGTAAAAAGRRWPGCWTARLGPAAAACGSWPEGYCTRSCKSYAQDEEFCLFLTQLKHIHTIPTNTQSMTLKKQTHMASVSKWAVNSSC